MNGYQYDSVYEYSLNTAFELIAADPTLTSSVPADNATSVAVDANIVLNFSENVDAESGGTITIKKSDNSTVETISVTSSQVTGTGSTQITVNPSSNFDDLTEYYVLISPNAFDDSRWWLICWNKFCNCFKFYISKYNTHINFISAR